MKIRLFYHSILSDWNHGNAHFLRGIVRELEAQGHDVRVYEAEKNWSLENLRAQHGSDSIRRLKKIYPDIPSYLYDPNCFDIESALHDADLVIVHEWSEHELVKQIGEARRRFPFVLLFHDTHHRMVTAPDEMVLYDLFHYDGVLAYGDMLRRRYLANSMVQHVWTWHEGADTRWFRPHPEIEPEADLVWIGNWGDEERTEELREFLIEPVKTLGLHARVYGVRYPESALQALREAGIEYRGWLPNFDVPEVFARHRLTVHVPRRPYARALPGIPTIRPFEAMACGIPLISAPWADTENMFRTGRDFISVQDGVEMKRVLRELLNRPDRRASLAADGLETIRNRHTCAHRVQELLGIYQHIQATRAGNLRPAVALGVVPAFA